MNQNSLSAYYGNKRNNHRTRANILMLLLMPVVYIMLLGCPGKIGSYLVTYSYFVPLVYFILFGFFALTPDRSRTRRFKRLKYSMFSALFVLVVMLIINTIVSLVYLSFTPSAGNIFGFGFSVKHTIFDFLVLNVWPFRVGKAIWFVHSLVYAYLYFMLMEKLKLNKYHIPVLIVLYVILLATGEFSAFCGFPIFGYPYIPAGAFTRAIPYMLIGMLIRRYVDKLPKIPQYAYIIAFFAGLLFAALEIVLLQYINKYSYPGHTIGFAIMAISLCCFTLAKPAKAKKPGLLATYSRKYAIRMYVLCQPVAIISWLIIGLYAPVTYFVIVKEHSFAISFIISFIITILISLVKKLFIVISMRFSKRKFMRFIYKIFTFDITKNT